MKNIIRANGTQLFRLLMVGFLFGSAPFALLLAILSIIGVVPVEINGKETYGIAGFIYFIITIPVFSLMWTCMVWLYLKFGLWIYSIFYKAPHESEELSNN